MWQLLHMYTYSTFRTWVSGRETKTGVEKRSSPPPSLFLIAVAEASLEQENLENSIRRRMCLMFITEGVIQTLRKTKLELEFSKGRLKRVFAFFLFAFFFFFFFLSRRHRCGLGRKENLIHLGGRGLSGRLKVYIEGHKVLLL